MLCCCKLHTGALIMVFPLLLAAGLGLGAGALASKGGREGLFGSKEKNYQQSLLGAKQQPLYKQLLQAGQQPGAGGAFGQSADYYRDLLSNNDQTNQMMAAPQMRQFNEEIIPSLSEQFAGMGAGGLTSSGFRNAAINAGTDLSERLGSIRAQLRNQGAAGLAGIGQAGLGQFNENIHRPAGQGFLGSVAPAIGSGIGMALGGPIGGMIGGGLGSAFGGGSSFGSSSPYGRVNQMSDSVTRSAGWS